MYALTITDSEMAVLSYNRFCESHPIISKRFHAVYLESTGHYSRIEIAAILNVTSDTITDYVKLYNSGGINALKTIKCGQHNVSELEAYVDILLKEFEENPPCCSAEARKKIFELTGIERSLSQVRSFLKRHGLKYIKAAQIPSKANPEAQAKFLEEKLNPLIDSAKEGNIHLLFMDSAHPVMGVFLCALWCLERVFVKSSSGRKRLNILGAVNAITKEINFLTNETYINAAVVEQFLLQLRIYYYDMKPIYIVLDNARYQHCDLVRYAAWQLNIHLVFLPTYSPNLNIIERLWKWLKKKTLYGKFFSDFTLFKKAIIQNLNDANILYQNELDSLLTLKFQTF
jgi:transposase